MSCCATPARRPTRIGWSTSASPTAASPPSRPSSRRRSTISVSMAALVAPGFVETHIHLDKSCIIDRCSIVEGTLQEAIAETARAKRAFTEEDIVARARRTLERAVLDGTMHMRTHVEVDPRVGLKGFRAVTQLKRDYAWASTSRSASSRRRGCSTIPGTEELLVAGLRRGRRPDRRLPLRRHAADRAYRAHLRHRPPLRPRHRLPPRLRSRPSWMHLDEVCARPTRPLRRPRRRRPCHQAVRHPARAPDRNRAASSPMPVWPSPCCRPPTCSSWAATPTTTCRAASPAPTASPSTASPARSPPTTC